MANESNGKMDNIKNLLSDDKTRMFVGLTLICVVAAMGIGYMSISRNKAQLNPVTTSVNTSNDIQALPGTVTDKDVIALQQEKNNQNLANAQNNNQSSVPVLTNNAKEIAVTQEPAKEITPEIATPVNPEPAPVVEKAVEPAPVVDNTPLMNAIGGLVEKWQPPEQNIEVDYTGQAKKNATNTTSVTPQVAISEAKAEKDVGTGQIIKASTILHAVLITAINSDEPGPILAEIVTGDLKGSRLIGNFTKAGSNEKMVLKFTNISSPMFKSTMAIDAYAIDPETARTAIATDVDHHYFAKYGMMLASSFVKAYADAVKSSNTTTTTSVLGSVTETPKGEFSQKDKMIQAIGGVGEAVAKDVEKNNQVQPTITIDSGTTVGLLIMKDFAY